MNHLTDEQFEDIMQGKVSPPAHLDQCPECQKQLAEKQAMARRLRLAFDSVRPGADLADEIRRQIKLASRVSQTTPVAHHVWVSRLPRRIWSSLVAAAAILVVALPLGLYLTTSSPASAAQKELVKIHYHSVEPHEERCLREVIRLLGLAGKSQGRPVNRVQMRQGNFFKILGLGAQN